MTNGVSGMVYKSYFNFDPTDCLPLPVSGPIRPAELPAALVQGSEEASNSSSRHIKG